MPDKTCADNPVQAQYELGQQLGCAARRHW